MPREEYDRRFTNGDDCEFCKACDGDLITASNKPDDMPTDEEVEAYLAPIDYMKITRSFG